MEKFWDFFPNVKCWRNSNVGEIQMLENVGEKAQMLEFSNNVGKSGIPARY
jgi:hypothetical protein